ncbi:MAG: hypothetical protein F4X22_03845 [Gemmatimonadales bacterium]|nr:hypothetical protein [Candidatus Palauibacter denitrificans]
MTARRALCFPGRAAALALALLALSAMTAPAPAAAQSVLVSNIGQANTGGDSPLVSFDLAQGFTTGSNTGGYTLTSVDVNFLHAPSGLSVKIATGLPSATNVVATLSNPTLSTGTLTFTAPASTTLSAGTTYWVVIEGSAGTVRNTGTSSEDSGAAAGWSIADASLFRTASSTGGWGDDNVVRKIRVNGSAATANPPGAPGAPTVAQGPTSGSLAVSWTAPTSGSAITDYDLRYFKGSADPDSESKWVTEGAPGLPEATRTVTADTIRGLLASTAYRVQVRAANASGEGAWSSSGSATTAAVPSTNNPPKVFKDRSGSGSNVCDILTDSSQPVESVTMPTGNLASFQRLVLRGAETTEWPASCTGSLAEVPNFDDRDAEQLFLTIDAVTGPDNVRLVDNTPELTQPAAQPGGDARKAGFLWVRPMAAFRTDTVRIDVTATDPHGASVSTWYRLIVQPILSSTSAPRFASTASPPAYTVNQAIAPFVLPAATGGDVGTIPGDPYFYRVSGLPPELTFDAVTRTISGTPRTAGTHRITYKADDPDVAGEDDGDTAVQTFNIVVRGDGSTDPPPAPTGLTVAQGPTSGSLAVSWTPPPSGSAITDYDLRYFKGTADPSSESDWVTEAPGLPDATRTVTADTIRGLLAETEYQVQVRAANGNGEGAWSPSGSATTAAAPGTNNAPRVVRFFNGATIRCQVKTDFSTPSLTATLTIGQLLAFRDLVPRESDTTEWPAVCAASATGRLPLFDDRDAEQLFLTLDYTPPDPGSARFSDGAPQLIQPSDKTGSTGALVLQGISAFRPDTVRIDVTATDPHGASASTWVRVILTTSIDPDPVNPPRFASTASPPAYTVNAAIAPLVLPAATGGTVGVARDDPYFYAVRGLPPGLAFDAATRTISGTPRTAGTHRVTYKADDLDDKGEGDGDSAVQTFNIVVRGDGSTDPPPAPTGLTVAQGPTSGSLAVSWTPPPSGSAITDYDLRYFKGTADPSSESDWVTEAPGLPDATRTVTADTIRGLLAETEYQVQVRAANGNGEGAWSPSGSATTAAAPGTNNAPRVVRFFNGATIRCQVKTDFSTPSLTATLTIGQLLAFRDLVPRESDTTEWPAVCAASATGRLPLFDDRDAEQLFLTLDYTPPDPGSARFSDGAPQLIQPSDKTGSTGALVLQGISAFRPDTVRIDVTATDPHGASASTWVRVILTTSIDPDPVNPPRFASTASPPAYTVNAAIAPLVLPAATGGTVGVARDDPYFYAVRGLPPGLAFDAATRTISGTPRTAGTHRVTYKADDLDDKGEGDGDSAVQTFVIAVAGDGPAIRSLGIVSTPTIDSDSDGTADTYGLGDVMAVEVEFTEAVVVTGSGGGNMTLRLDLGADDADLTNSRAVVWFDSHSGNTLRWEHTVRAVDVDADGVWVQTASATDDAVVFLAGGATIKDAGGDNATLTLSGLPTTGDPRHKVDGSRTPPPAVTGAEVDGTKLTLSFSQKLNTATAPAASRFTVARTPAVTVSSVAFSADSTKVDLTLSAAVRSGETGITVAYAKGDDTNPLQNPSGTEVANFTGLAVTNLTAPTVTAVEVIGTTLTLTFDAELSASTTPGTNRFEVTGTAEATSVTAVAVSPADARKLNLTVSPRVGPAETGVTVAYTAGTDTNPLQDADGNKVKDFTGVSVTNATPPAVTEAEVDGAELTLTFDAALATTATPAPARFTVARTSSPAPPEVTVTGAAFRSGDATKLDLTLSEAVRSAETGITVAYAKAGDANPLQKAGGGGGEVADFTGQAVTNETPPSVTDAEVNGAALELTFDAALSTTATPDASRFTVSGMAAGTTVSSMEFRSGDATKLDLTLSAEAGSSDTDVRLAYAAGGDANALQDAGGRKVKDFTGRAVRNPASGVPSFPPEAPTTLSVRENSAAGTLVGTVAATDPGGDALTYTLASTESGGTDHQSFAIGRNDGRITVASGAVLNYEAKTSYAVTVTFTAI